MSSKWEKTFEVSVPVERVWQAFTEEAEMLLGPPPGVVPPGPQRELKVLEAVPLRLLKWEQMGHGLPDRAEFTAVFESREGGSRITITRAGFGEGEDAVVFGKSNGLGWEHGIMDLVLYLETGQLVNRHYDGCSKSSMSMVYRETDAGVEVCRVGQGGFADQVGLQRGDRIVRIGGAPVYCRSDLWQLNERTAAGTELAVEFIRGRDLLSGRGCMSPMPERLWGE